MEKLVDIIIPAYKAHNDIFKALSSIAMQKMADQIQVTIVNDCCPEGDYKEIIKKFKGYLDIKEIKLKENGGPGRARREGINNTSCPYIMFMDADDTFMSAFVITQLYHTIVEMNENVCFSSFIAEGDGINQYIPHVDDFVWVFGKIYKRAFLEENNITFTDLRANEDTCFNRKILMTYKEAGKDIPYLDTFTYFWHLKETSITRINEGQYTYDQSTCGFVDGIIEMFDWADTREFSIETLKDEAMGIMVFLYIGYCDVGSVSEVFQPQNLEYLKKFYHKVFKRYGFTYENEYFIKSYEDTMRVINQDDNFHPQIFMAQPSIVEVMNMLENLPYDEQDIYKIWEELPQELKDKNIECGVCSSNYYKKL